MRLEKIEILLQIAMKMQSYTGVRLREIEEEFEVSHRTAQNYRNVLERVFPQMEQTTTEGKELSWKIPAGTLDKLIGIKPEELSALDFAITELSANNLPDQAKQLSMLKDKVLCCLKSNIRTRLEVDSEYISENSSITAKPGPISDIPTRIYDQLREAILTSQEVRFTYTKNEQSTGTNKVVQPYGILSGHRHYLLGLTPGSEISELKKYALPRMTDLKILDKNFERHTDFNLSEYASKSFGIFLEDDAPYEVIWQFAPEAKDVAREYKFHKNQTVTENVDGSLTVAFSAGGLQEMAWHLCLWGDKVEILSPPELIDLIDTKKISWKTLP